MDRSRRHSNHWEKDMDIYAVMTVHRTITIAGPYGTQETPIACAEAGWIGYIPVYDSEAAAAAAAQPGARVMRLTMDPPPPGGETE